MVFCLGIRAWVLYALKVETLLFENLRIAEHLHGTIIKYILKRHIRKLNLLFLL